MRVIPVLGVVLVLCVAISAFWWERDPADGRSAPGDVRSRDESVSSEEPAQRLSPVASITEISEADAAQTPTDSNGTFADEDRSDAAASVGRIGRFPKRRASDSPAVAAVLAAEKSGQSAHLATRRMPPPFDPVRYAQDREAYCRQVVPGRIWQMAMPGPDVPVLKAQGDLHREAVQGESVLLSVRAPVGSPVTYFAFDGGAFPNKLGCQTVFAGTNGVASIAYMPTSGVYHETNVGAACPAASGQVVFRLFVAVPKRKLENSVKQSEEG